MTEQHCAICGRPDRVEIDRRLTAGEQYTVLSGRYDLPARQLMRHHEGGHIPTWISVDERRAEAADRSLCELTVRKEQQQQRLHQADRNLEAALRAMAV